MKTFNLYLIAWDNGNEASGIFPQVFTSKLAAERFGRNWKLSIVEVEDTQQEREEAEGAYEWEVVQCPFYVEKQYEWPGHSWDVYTEEKAPRSPIVKACPHAQVVPSTADWLRAELKQGHSDYIRNKSVTL